MSESSYGWGEPFQLRLLALQLREPAKALDLVEPGFFTNPMMVDISRNIRDVYKRHPNGDVSISETTLKELVKEGLGRKGREHWPHYRRMIRRIYKMKLLDKKVVVDQAIKFAKENRYREALVQAERAVTARKYDDVLKPFEAVRIFDGKHSTKTSELKLPVYLLHQLLSAEFESEGNYLIDTIVPRGGAIMSFGLPKGLKSWFSTAVALDAAIGDGKALGYFDVPRPVKVLLVQVEDPASRTQSRLQRLREARPFRQNPYPGNLRIVTRCPLNLLDSSWVGELEAVIEKQRTELIIFDVFRRLFRGNVNSPEDTAAFLEVVDHLRDKYQLAAWIVHHSNKRTEGEMMTKALGSINLTAWGDVALYFKNKQESNHVARCNLEIETKDRAIENELQVVLDDEGEPMLWVEEAKAAPDKLEKAVSQLGSKWIVEDLAEVLELSNAGAYKILQAWLERGIAQLVRRGVKGRPARYKFVRSETPK